VQLLLGLVPPQLLLLLLLLTLAARCPGRLLLQLEVTSRGRCQRQQ
jgi:hypothetical protein